MRIAYDQTKSIAAAAKIMFDSAGYNSGVRGKRGSGRRRLRELTRAVVDSMEILEDVRSKHSGVGGMSKALVQVGWFPSATRAWGHRNAGDECGTSLCYLIHLPLTAAGVSIYSYVVAVWDVVLSKYKRRTLFNVYDLVGNINRLG